MSYDELLMDAEDRMAKAVEVLKGEMRSMRTGRAHPGLIEGIRVDYYGSPTPLSQIANISAPEADQLVVKPFDASAMGEIEKAILKSDLGISPTNDGKLVRLKVPPLSEERRKQLVARAKEVAEEARVSVRNVRRDANKHGEQLQKDGDISEDQVHTFKDAVQDLTKKYEGQIDADVKAKTEELMAI